MGREVPRAVEVMGDSVIKKSFENFLLVEPLRHLSYEFLGQ
jgi:hypothetical protein